MFADAEYVKKIIGRVVDKVLSENFIVYVEESRCTVQSINVQWDFVFYRDIRFSTSFKRRLRSMKRSRMSSSIPSATRKRLMVR